jgi:hypothetical protein
MLDQAKGDRLQELTSLPPLDSGAPLPSLVTDDSHLLLAYMVSQHDSPSDGAQPRLVSASSPDKQIAIVRFQTPYGHSFGPPNDEALAGHPLSSHGLKPYSWFEVLESSWIQSLQEMNSVHPRHRPESFKTYHHYIATFHDSTFECVARGFGVIPHSGSMRSAVERMAQFLEDGAS